MKTLLFVAIFAITLFCAFDAPSQIQMPSNAVDGWSEVCYQSLPHSDFRTAIRQVEALGAHEAANYLRLHERDSIFDFYYFYRQYVAPNVSLFGATALNQQTTLLNPEQIALGKFLFYDPILSQNAKRSCASCHRPEKFFCDNRIVSRAFAFSENLTVNAPTLINAALQNRFFHDGRLTSTEQVYRAVIENPKEFNNTYANIIARLNSSRAYQDLFKAAYPSEIQINEKIIEQSLTAFLQSLTTYQTPFDSLIVLRVSPLRDSPPQPPRRGGANKLDRNSLPSGGLGGAYAQDNQSPILGFNLFMSKAQCAQCHAPPNFGGAIKNQNYFFKINNKNIKTPSLRTVAYTEPYMYDGRVPTLARVLVDSIHTHLIHQSKPITLNASEQQQIISFLTHLTANKGIDFTMPQSLPFIPHFEHRRVGGVY